MTALPLNLNLSDDKMKLLAEVAQTRNSEPSELLESIVLEWLDREAKRRRGREVFSQFSKGIGTSQPPHTTANEHDQHLYGST